MQQLCFRSFWVHHQVGENHCLSSASGMHVEKAAHTREEGALGGLREHVVRHLQLEWDGGDLLALDGDRLFEPPTVNAKGKERMAPKKTIPIQKFFEWNTIKNIL